jgi:hypothetical protein
LAEPQKVLLFTPQLAAEIKQSTDTVPAGAATETVGTNAGMPICKELSSGLSLHE